MLVMRSDDMGKASRCDEMGTEGMARRSFRKRGNWNDWRCERDPFAEFEECKTSKAVAS